MLLDQLGDPPDQPAAIRCVHPPPRRIVRRTPGARRAPRGRCPQPAPWATSASDLLGRGVDRLERLARRGLDPLAVDQQLVRRANEAVRLLLATDSATAMTLLLSEREPPGSRFMLVMPAHGSPLLTTEQAGFTATEHDPRAALAFRPTCRASATKFHRRMGRARAARRAAGPRLRDRPRDGRRRRGRAGLGAAPAAGLLRDRNARAARDDPARGHGSEPLRAAAHDPRGHARGYARRWPDG